MCSYADYEQKLKENYLNSSPWENLKREEHISLLIGSGVTKCIVGDWNELLNEVAILLCCGDHLDLQPDTVRKYIETMCGGSFLPQETNQLEKGEYLRFAPKVYDGFHSEAAPATPGMVDRNLEKLFSYRVLIAMERLMDRKLRDGAGQYPLTYKEDFINWCNDAHDYYFEKIGRKSMSENDKVEELLKDYNDEEIAERLSRKLSEKCKESCEEPIRISPDAVANAVQSGAVALERIKGIFGALIDNALEKKIKDILETAVCPNEKMGKILRVVVAHALWRPSYCTLEALLRLCLEKNIAKVISYNFDTVFDRLLADKGVQGVLCPKREYKKVCVYGLKSLKPMKIDGFESSADSEAIHIYHVHGILDSELKDDSKLKDMSPIIFSETAYKSYSNDPANCEKLYLANAYHEGCLLCVGFSGSDDGFRRIVERLSSLQHSIIYGSDAGGNGIDKIKFFLTRGLNEIQKPYKFSKDTDQDNLAPAFGCVSTCLGMIQRYFSYQLNTKILWATDYEEMANNLRGI